MKPEELHSYPPKIVCRFTPTAKAPQKTTCTLTLLGLDRPVTVSIPLFSPKRVVDCVRLKVWNYSEGTPLINQPRLTYM